MRPLPFLLCVLPLAALAEDYRSYEADNEVAEMHFIARPYPRLTHFRLKGQESPLHFSREYEYIGVRSWFLEPVQTALSGLPALQPAEVERLGPRAFRLVSAPDDSSGMQLFTEITLDDERPLVRLRHGFKNLRDQQRRVAAWALTVIRPDHGTGITRWRDQGRRAFLFWPATQPDEKGLHLGPQALALDYRILPRGGWLKVGTNTDCGWVAYVWGGQALKSSVAFVANAEYPEDGGTVTMFNSTSAVFAGKPRFGEIENVGPLTDLLPGHVMWLEQTLELVPGIQGSDPEQWLEALE